MPRFLSWNNARERIRYPEQDETGITGENPSEEEGRSVIEPRYNGVNLGRRLFRWIRIGHHYPTAN